MKFHAVFSPLMFFILLVMDDSHLRSVVSFELRPMLNTTKNRLMMPLRLDDMVLTSRRMTSKGSDEDMVGSSPRGIVLNTAIGGLTFAGGLMGFVTKGSKASLTAGSIFGGLLLLSSLLISKSSTSKSTKGNILGFSVSAMLGLVMGKKFLASKKFMPAGLLASLSTIGFIYNLIETKIVYSSNGGADNKESTSSSATKTDRS